jgi:hypothetical protein
MNTDIPVSHFPDTTSRPTHQASGLRRPGGPDGAAAPGHQPLAAHLTRSGYHGDVPAAGAKAQGGER